MEGQRIGTGLDMSRMPRRPAAVQLKLVSARSGTWATLGATSIHAPIPSILFNHRCISGAQIPDWDSRRCHRNLP